METSSSPIYTDEKTDMRKWPAYHLTVKRERKESFKILTP